MHPVLFHWRGIKIHSYPALLYIGVVLGVLGGTYAATLHGLDPARVFTAQLLLVLPALVGARLLFVISRWDIFRVDPCRIWSRRDGGAGMYGGLVLAFLISLPLLAVMSLPLGAFWDAATITMLIGMIFTRVGCLLNGCCAGKATQGRLSLYLPNVEGVWRRRMPTQILEACVGALLLIASLTVWNRLPFAGAIFLGNLAVYGMVRCGLESMRECIDKVGGVALNRAISIGLVTVAMAGLVYFSLSGAGTRSEGSVVRAELPAQFGAGPDADGWYILLATLSVLIVLLLFRFVGCDRVFGLDSIDPPASGYGDLIKSDNPVAYWRLGEQKPPAPATMNGVTAVNTANPMLFSGAYIVPPNPLPADPPDHSAGAPGNIEPQLPGLLPNEPNLGGMFFDGGYVRVGGADPFNPATFTVESLVLPQWDLSQKGNFYCMIKSFDAAQQGQGRKAGFGIYAAPADVLNLAQSEYHWRVFLGNGSEAKILEVKDFIVNPQFGLTYNGSDPKRIGDPGPRVEAQPTYLVFSFDGTNCFLYYYYPDRNMDWLTYELIPPSGSYVPNHTQSDLLIGMDDQLGLPSPLLFPFKGKIQELAIYDNAVDLGILMNHGLAAFHS